MENRIFLNRYRLSLGRNGSPVEMHRAPHARTFRAHEVDTGREVALTIVSPAPADTVLLEKLKAEAIASKEVSHINIPRLYDAGRENDELIYVSEYFEGHTALAWVEARGPLTVAAVLRVALQVTDAMNATVFQRLYHPALNPENILFVAGQTGEGDWPPIKVLNWYGPVPELADPVDARAESAARFAAPEQLHSGTVDVRSEIYSLGATMWFLLTGQPLTPNARGGLGAAISQLRGVPKIVRHLLERMVRLEPQERPQDPVALASYLQTCLARVERRANMERRIGIPLLSQARVAAPRTPMPGKRLAGALAVMLVAMLAILFFTQSLISRTSPPLTARTSRVSASAPGESVRPNESTLPGEPAAGEKEADKTAEGPTSSPSAAMAAAPSSSRGELVSISPVPTARTSRGFGTAPDESVRPNESTLAGEPAAAVKESTDKTPASRTSSPSAAVAAAPSSSRGELISISPVPETASSASQPEAAPGERLATVESNPPVSEAPPPAAGPSGNEEPQVADRSDVEPGGEESSPNETAPDVAVAPPPTVRNEPHSAVIGPTPAQLADSSAASEATAMPPASPRKTSPLSRRKSWRDGSKTRLAKNRSRSKHIVKRAQPLPKLRVGSAPAEYVGTTKGGDWILSVDTTGETIVVPPPPGYVP